MYAALRSIGAYTPENCISNKDLESVLDTTDEWIVRRTGIKTRYFADENQMSSTLGVHAARKAIERAHIHVKDIDLVIVGTLSPDFINMPSTACLIAHQLGISNVPAFDIAAACSGFVYLVSIAKAYVESGMARCVLIVGAEKVSSVLDKNDRSTYILFGDGAGAAIISATEKKDESILDVHIAADGKYADYLYTPRHIKNNEQQCMKMRGNDVFKVAVHKLTQEVQQILMRNKMDASDIDYFVPHQANYRIIKAVSEQLSFDDSQVVLTVARYGNTSAASIPMAINDIYEEGKLKYGHRLLLDALGGGFTWGSAILHFAGTSL